MDIRKEGMKLSLVEKASVFPPYINWLMVGGYDFQLHAFTIPYKVAPNDLKHKGKEEEVKNQIKRFIDFK